MPGTSMVYVALLDEDVEVWRPVEAEPVGGDLYRLTGEIPDGEVWAFAPGDVVRCETRMLSEGRPVSVATEKIR